MPLPDEICISPDLSLFAEAPELNIIFPLDLVALAPLSITISPPEPA